MNALLWVASACLAGAAFAVTVATFGLHTTAIMFAVIAVGVIVVDCIETTSGGGR